MTLVYKDPKFDGQFPENYQWELIDSIKLCKLACDLRDQIKNELKQPPGNRVNVPGLRFTLSRIAGMSEV